MECEQIGTLTGGVWDKMHEQSRRVYDKSGLSPTLNTCGGDLKRNGQGIISYQNGIDGVNEDQINVAVENRFLNPQYRIRKLTPLECLRLMGFDDEDYKKIKAIGMSDSQIYKQAGNSIVVNVLENIFGKMIQEQI